MVWLRLDRHFYDKPELKQIESMDGGKDYIITYLLLLLNGGEKMPCDKSRLSKLSGVPEEKVKRALNEFYKRGLVRLSEEKEDKPSFQEVAEYAQEIKSGADVKRFYEWYSASGFKYKGKPMDWKAKLKEWSETERPKRSANPFLNMMKEQMLEQN